MLRFSPRLPTPTATPGSCLVPHPTLLPVLPDFQSFPLPQEPWLYLPWSPNSSCHQWELRMQQFYCAAQKLSSYLQSQKRLQPEEPINAVTVNSEQTSLPQPCVIPRHPAHPVHSQQHRISSLHLVYRVSLCFCLNPAPPQQSIHSLRTDIVSVFLISCAQCWNTLPQSFYSQHYSGPLR